MIYIIFVRSGTGRRLSVSYRQIPDQKGKNRCDGGGLRGDPVSVALIIHEMVWFRF
ncbi:MAG: hypothetical protein SBU_001423 [Candidatus Syntrophoarchaeum butanivorans]|uniref:Uncharacterized protein n=1 Tax=Candidatus Syntropharchaeum butanivorans TaxID=1839936 RepID=A0A1F2P396_9EURY|nr:MAG: hypothetical protein SBU_001423 [Candidatus Syntrophoarchaeum butanivorans]